jgi:hypothetical protein
MRGLLNITIEEIDIEFSDAEITGYCVLHSNEATALVAQFGRLMVIGESGAEIKPTHEAELALARFIGDNCFGTDTNNSADGVFFEEPMPKGRYE